MKLGTLTLSNPVMKIRLAMLHTREGSRNALQNIHAGIRYSNDGPKARTKSKFLGEFADIL